MGHPTHLVTVSNTQVLKSKLQPNERKCLWQNVVMYAWHYVNAYAYYATMQLCIYDIMMYIGIMYDIIYILMHDNMHDIMR